MPSYWCTVLSVWNYNLSLVTIKVSLLFLYYTMSQSHQRNSKVQIFFLHYTFTYIIIFHGCITSSLPYLEHSPGSAFSLFLHWMLYQMYCIFKIAPVNKGYNITCKQTQLLRNKQSYGTSLSAPMFQGLPRLRSRKWLIMHCDCSQKFPSPSLPVCWCFKLLTATKFFIPLVDLQLSMPIGWRRSNTMLLINRNWLHAFLMVKRLGT